jgi:hypothetical protein
MEEHRNSPRHRGLKASNIEFAGGAVNCMVRNISKLESDENSGPVRVGFADRRNSSAVPRHMAQRPKDGRGI